MQILTVVGARPQFIKAAAVCRQIRSIPGLKEILVHTGQHFDQNMSQVFFDELDIPRPDCNLEIGGGSHGQNTGRMIEALEKLLMDEPPDWVLVYGDTDSTLAGALAAAKLNIPVAHVEAGLRSFNRGMPEEINRVLTDQLSTILFCPTETAVKNLHKEGFPHQLSTNNHQPITDNQFQITDNRQLITNVGDVMYDAAQYYASRAEERSWVLQRLGLESGQYVLATVHRAENTDQPSRLQAIMQALELISREMPVVLPLHPRTRAKLQDIEPVSADGLLITDPVGYLDMVMLEKESRLVITDSGGVQKEAFFHNVPCVTLRHETEWAELVELGWNRLAPPQSAQEIVNSVWEAMDSQPLSGVQPYGSGKSAGLIVDVLQAQNRISS